MKFTRHFAYGPAYEAYQAISVAMMEVLKNIAGLNVGFDASEVPEMLHNKEHPEGEDIALTSSSLRDMAGPEKPAAGKRPKPQTTLLSEKIATLQGLPTTGGSSSRGKGQK